MAKLHVYISAGLTETECPPLFRNFYERVAAACIRAGYESYLPHEATDPNDPMTRDFSENLIYRTDRQAVSAADLILALCDSRSFGVGGEIEIAVESGTPVVIFVSATKQPSGGRTAGNSQTILKSITRMVKGNPMVWDINGFTTIDELDQKVETYLRDNQVRFTRLRQLRGDASHIRSSMTLSLKDRLRVAREGLGLSIETAATRIGIRQDYLIMLEDGISATELRNRGFKDQHVSFLTPESSLLCNPSLIMLERMAKALEVTVGYLSGEENDDEADSKLIRNFLKERGHLELQEAFERARRRPAERVTRPITREQLEEIASILLEPFDHA